MRYTARYTVKSVNKAFARFCEILALPTGNKPGDYALDSYMGYKVVQFTDHGGESEPFGSRRYSAKEFCQAVYFMDFALSGRYVTQVVESGAGYALGVTETLGNNRIRR